MASFDGLDFWEVCIKPRWIDKIKLPFLWSSNKPDLKRYAKLTMDYDKMSRFCV